MTIDQYSLNDGEYIKLFLKKADQFIDLYYRFSNKLATGYQASVPEDVKRKLFEDVLYATNDSARTLHRERHPEPEIGLEFVSNTQLKNELDSLKTVLLSLVDALSADTKTNQLKTN